MDLLLGILGALFIGALAGWLAGLIMKTTLRPYRQHHCGHDRRFHRRLVVGPSEHRYVQPHHEHHRFSVGRRYSAVHNWVFQRASQKRVAERHDWIGV